MANSLSLNLGYNYGEMMSSMSVADDRAAEVIAQIWNLVGPVIQSEGKELIEVEYRREPHGWVLRLYIDRENGVSVDDCAHVSQFVGDLLDVADAIQNPYHLEVSSPGLDRPLRRLEHFQRYLGKIIDVRAHTFIENRRKFKGILTSVGPEAIKVDCEGRSYEIPFTFIERARLCYFESFEE